MDKTYLRLHIFEFVILLVTLISLFTWVRTETREDNRQLRNDLFTVIEAIREDIKDFHGRLCAIEERTRGDK